jgi:uncharacterized protein (TIGR03435 family)
MERRASARPANTSSAQSPGRQETFEVASIRRNLTGNQQGSGLAGPQPGGRFIALGATLRRLAGDGYGDVRIYEVVGGPAWVATDRFDVNARAEGDRPPDVIRRMVWQMLVDRFKLVAHTERREVPVYTMTLARADRKTGSRMRASDPKCAEEARNYIPTMPTGAAPPCGDYRLSARSLTARGMTMSSLSGLLEGRVGRPVIDRTGLDGAFDLDIEWSSDLGLKQAPPDSAGAAQLSPDGLSLFTALQEQLGLKLEPGRGPVDILVIDSAEPLSEN